MHGATLLLELGGVILGLGILGRLAGRLGLSAIPLYLLAGLAFGEGGLLPLVTAQEFIEVGAEIGVILLLLLLGLEYSADELVGNLRAATPAGLVVAGLAQRLQVSAAVDAFLVGIALSGPAADAARALLTPLRDLFAAVFFVFFGLRTDPGLIPAVALAATGLAVTTAATKVAAGWWAARRAGIGTRGRWRAGAALVARGEFSIVIAGLAVSAGREPDLGPLAATYVLVLAVLGPLLARVVAPLVTAARRRAGRAPATPEPGPAGEGDRPRPRQNETERLRSP